MPLEILCPAGHRLQVMPDQMNQKVRCPTCQQVFVVPEQRVSPPPVFKDNDLAGLAEATAAPVKPRKKASRMPQIEVATAVRYGAQAILMLGLMLVLCARGCDTLGNREAARLQAKAKLAKDQFNDTFETRRSSIQAQIEDLNNKKDSSKEDNTRVKELREKLSDIEKDRTKQSKEKTTGEWRSMEIDARDAAANNVMSAYWRELLFVFGTAIFSLGLLALGFNGQGAERWICLSMLAIIVFSLYVGGVAWIGALPLNGLR